MNPLCWLANVLKLIIALKCVRIRVFEGDCCSDMCTCAEPLCFCVGVCGCDSCFSVCFDKGSAVAVCSAQMG